MLPPRRAPWDRWPPWRSPWLLARLRGMAAGAGSRCWRWRPPRPAIWAAGVTARVSNRRTRGSWWWTKCWASGSRWPAPRTLNWKSWLAAFVLFRLFDIWKPAPVRQLEAAARRRRHCRRRCHGGHLRRTCVIRGRMFQSLLNMAIRKDSERAAADRAGYARCGHRRRRVADPGKGVSPGRTGRA